jgi:peptidoglycan/xylan/chitin deacetylase (PgdA/CDA1 family)
MPASRPPFIVTTSWDDGHPSDQRVAELLARHGLSGTFYVPSRNSEGRPVMSIEEVRGLSAQFELGGHSRDHVVLTTLPAPELNEQLGSNKRWLEDVTGKVVDGFCYVRGKHNRHVTQGVVDAGFKYARTVVGLDCRAGFHAFRMPVTLQFYPHRPSVYLRNFVRNPMPGPQLMAAVLARRGLVERVESALRVAQLHGRMFHLWGHSWELDELGLWEEVDQALQVIAKNAPASSHLSNGETVQLLAR